jgi:predicted amidohydrolase
MSDRRLSVLSFAERRKNMFNQIKVAAISFTPIKFDVEANVNKLHKLFSRAAQRGAQLALAPEGAIEGYVVNEIIEGRSSANCMLDVAITTRGSVMQRFRNLAGELDICLAFGFAERIGDNIFNSAVFIDNNGKICGKYHKMQFAEGYHRSWWFNRIGQKSRSFKSPFGKCGFMICNDRWNPDIARIPVLDGAQYLLVPSFGSCSKKQDNAVLARARENGVPLVEANVGVTMIVSKGEIVKLSRDKETITCGVIDIPAVPLAKNRDEQENLFLRRRRTHMKKNYERRMRKVTK